VTPTTIKNCWRHSGILTEEQNQLLSQDPGESSASDVPAVPSAEAQLQAALESLPRSTVSVDAAAYAAADDEITTSADGPRSIEDIVADCIDELVEPLQPDANDDLPDLPDLESKGDPPPVSHDDAMHAAKTLVQYGREQEMDWKSLLQLEFLLRSLQSKQAPSPTIQTTLDAMFSRQ